MDKNRILIVGDQALTKQEVEQIYLTNENVVSEIARNYETGLNLFKRETPDLIICDLHLIDSKSGNDLVLYAKTIKNVPVIFVANFNEDSFLSKAFHTNPDAFLIKPFSLIQLLITIKRVLYQYKNFKNKMAVKIPATDTAGQVSKECRQKPTIRELEVIQHIAEGETTKLIADKLCISYTTVQTHRKNLLNKYNARSCAELVNIACKNNWINLAG